MDSPAHINPAGSTIDAYDTQSLSGPAVVLNVRTQLHTTYEITEDALRSFYHEYQNYWKGYWIILNTGWGVRWNEPSAYRNVQEDGTMAFPYLTADAVDFLVSAGIKGIMIDTLDPDGGKAPFIAHQKLLNADILIVENIRTPDLKNYDVLQGYVLVSGCLYQKRPSAR